MRLRTASANTAAATTVPTASPTTGTRPITGSSPTR